MLQAPLRKLTNKEQSALLYQRQGRFDSGLVAGKALEEKRKHKKNTDAMPAIQHSLHAKHIREIMNPALYYSLPAGVLRSAGTETRLLSQALEATASASAPSTTPHAIKDARWTRVKPCNKICI